MGNYINDTEQKLPKCLGNYLSNRADIIKQAAKETGFDVFLDENAVDNVGRKVPGFVALYTNTPGDHHKFWVRYEQLVKEQCLSS